MSTLNGDSSKPESIQDIAFKLAEEQLSALQQEHGPRERTIFVLGSKAVGKSTAINNFFERDETPRPTLALEYSYGRKTGAQQKHILHLWELGCMENAQELLKIPLRSNNIANLACVVMVDLSQPHRIWTDLKMAYEGLRDYMDSLNAQEMESSYEKSRQRVKKDHKDIDSLQLLPFPMVIVGGKYDLFIPLEPETKKHICRCLRSMAHLLGASLLFYSHKQQKLSKILRDTFSHLAFGSPSHPFRLHVTDHNDALSIWFGTDSWDKISPYGIQDILSIEANIMSEILQENQNTLNIAELKDPAKDQGFREGIIDEMRAQKNEELKAILKDAQMKGKFERVATQ